MLKDRNEEKEMKKLRVFIRDITTMECDWSFSNGFTLFAFMNAPHGVATTCWDRLTINLLEPAKDNLTYRFYNSSDHNKLIDPCPEENFFNPNSPHLNDWVVVDAKLHVGSHIAVYIKPLK